MSEETTKDFDNWILRNKLSNIDNENQMEEYLFHFIDDMVQFKIDRKEIKEIFEGHEEVDIESNIPIFQQTKPSYKEYTSDTQKWVGFVTAIFETDFKARLIDLNNSTTEEEASFEIAEVSEEDKSLFRIGAVFYWSVGYSVINGQVKKESFIRFKRTAELSEKDFNEAIDKADDIYKDLKWD